jgi:uncharacterized protein (DUF1778 family)
MNSPRKKEYDYLSLRLRGRTKARIKTAAKSAKMSVNEYLNRALEEITKDIVSEEEIMEEKEKTETFLDAVCGTWKTDKTADEIMSEIKSSLKSKKVEDLW